MGPRIVLLAALALCLLAGCAQEKAPWYSTQLAGSPAERARFEGAWYDEDGQIWATVSDDPQPRLDLRPWGGRPIVRIEHAQATGHGLYFSVLAMGEAPQAPGKAVLRFTSEGEGEIHQIVADPVDDCCVCGCPVPPARLKRNPSPVWFSRIAARHTREAIQKTREAVFDRLARAF